MWHYHAVRWLLQPPPAYLASHLFVFLILVWWLLIKSNHLRIPTPCLGIRGAPAQQLLAWHWTRDSASICGWVWVPWSLSLWWDVNKRSLLFRTQICSCLDGVAKVRPKGTPVCSLSEDTCREWDSQCSPASLPLSKFSLVSLTHSQ